jgi:hypothetical protein
MVKCFKGLGVGGFAGAYTATYTAHLQSTKAKHYIDTHTIVLYL